MENYSMEINMPDSQTSDPKNGEVINILREIQESPEVTQRELSSRAGISLGKVNFLVNALVKKGLVKVRNFKKSNNKYGYIYLLTPHGLEEKTRITGQFLKRKIIEYKQLEKEIIRLKKEIDK